MSGAFLALLLTLIGVSFMVTAVVDAALGLDDGFDLPSRASSGLPSKVSSARSFSAMRISLFLFLVSTFLAVS